jgi:hypothetical protein
MAETPPVVISASEVVGSPLCVASDDGQKVFLRLAASLKEGQPVILSFKNVSSLTSAFLNAAIGPLYGRFGESEIRKNLSITDMDPNDRTRLKRVVDTTKAYFDDPVRLKRAAREFIG